MTKKLPRGREIVYEEYDIRFNPGRGYCTLWQGEMKHVQILAWDFTEDD